MAVKKRKKARAVVCVVCKGNKKISAKKKCCSPKMTSRNKGSWNL